MEKKSQSSLEYLIIIALTLGIILPASYLFFNYVSESNVKLIDSQMSQVGRSIIDAAETVYYSGEGSKIILQLNIPEGIRNASIIGNRELVFNLTSILGDNQAVFFSAINITSSICAGTTCSLSNLTNPGSNKVKFESISRGKQVLISSSQ